MLIPVDVININVEVFSSETAEHSIIFIHGFSGSGKDWKNVISQLPENICSVTIDLPGHGRSDSPDLQQYYEPVFLNKIIDSIIDFLELKHVILAGYSMGGRVALTYAVNHQNNIDAIILESTTAGLQSESERKSRILQDEELSKRIEQNGIDDFVGYWTNLELFKSQKKLPIEVQQQIKIEKLKNNPTGLKNSLHGFGTGKMLSVWERLGLLQIPTLLITGEEDKKFNSINSEMVKLIPGAKHVIVENSGHNVHLEKPEVFVNLIKEFLISISHNKEDI